MAKENTQRNADIFHKFHSMGCSRHDLAIEYNLSEQRISQIIGRMEEKRVLPLTDLELSLHVEHDKLEAREIELGDRLIEVRNKRVEVHRRLDALMESRLREHMGGVRPEISPAVQAREALEN